MVLDLVPDLAELEAEADLQQREVVADGLGDPLLRAESEAGKNNLSYISAPQKLRLFIRIMDNQSKIFKHGCCVM